MGCIDWFSIRAFLIIVVVVVASCDNEEYKVALSYYMLVCIRIPISMYAIASACISVL